MLGSEVVDAGAAVALSSLSAILDDFTPIDPAPETRQPRLFVSQGPDKGKPERFPGGAELPVELPPPPVVEPPARRARNRRAR